MVSCVYILFGSAFCALRFISVFCPSVNDFCPFTKMLDTFGVLHSRAQGPLLSYFVDAFVEVLVQSMQPAPIRQTAGTVRHPKEKEHRHNICNKTSTKHIQQTITLQVQRMFVFSLLLGGCKPIKFNLFIQLKFKSSKNMETKQWCVGEMMLIF